MYKRQGTDYTVSYPKGMKNVGKYTVKVTLKGNYSGSKSMTYNINTKGTSVSKAVSYTHLAVYKRQTRDDAAGEALDKAGRTLGLPYPGGISICSCLLYTSRCV